MNAADYIQKLQKHHPAIKPDIGDIEVLRRTAEARGLDFDAARKAYDATPVDIATDNLNAMRPFLSADMQARIAEGQVAAGTIGLQTGSVYSQEIDEGCWAIVFPQGFTQLLYQAARSVARLFPTSSRNQPVTEELLEQTAAALTRLLWYHNTAAMWHPNTDPIEPEQLEIAGALSGFADEFFLAHELGHVTAGVSGIDETARQLGELPDGTEAQQVEFACDGYALQILLATAEARGGEKERDFAIAGAEFGLQLMRLMTQMGMTFTDTHPAADERVAYLARLRSELNVGNEYAELARRLETVLEHSVAMTTDELRVDTVAEDEVAALLPRIEAEAMQAAPHTHSSPMTEMVFMSRLESFGSNQSVAVALARLSTQRLERGGLDPQLHVDQEILNDAAATRLMMRASRSFYERLLKKSRSQEAD